MINSFPIFNEEGCATNEIKCPHCGQTLTVHEAGYADIVKQVRDSEFEQQLHERLELADQDNRNALELAAAKAAGEMQQKPAAKDAETQTLRSKLEAGATDQNPAVAEAF